MFLNEAPELAHRRSPDPEIHEMSLDSPFGEEPESGPGFGALLHPKDLHFHRREI
jgi:hypothetical protein